MNLDTFEEQLRAQFQEQPEPHTLSARIASRIQHQRRRTRMKMQVKLAFAGAFIFAFAFFALPVVRAQAALRRMAGALDGVQQMTATRFNITEDGREIPADITRYYAGLWRLERPSLSEATIYRDGRQYMEDRRLGCYVVEEKPNGPFSKGGDVHLSAILKDVPSLALDQSLQESVIDGREVVQAVIKNLMLPERYIIAADKKTDLPIMMWAEGLEQDRWVRRSLMKFDYETGVDAKIFALDAKLPQLSREQWAFRVTESLTKKVLASVPLGEVVAAPSQKDLKQRDLASLRRDGKPYRAPEEKVVKGGQARVFRVDVAEDGTIYILFQAGWQSGWSGYSFEVSDGTSSGYAVPELFTRVGNAFNVFDHVKGGPLQVQAFAPVDPQAWARRKLRVWMLLDEKRRIFHGFDWFEVLPDGKQILHHTKPAYRVPVLDEEIAVPTCIVRPDYMRYLTGGEWGDDLNAQLSLAGARARYWQKEGDVQQERRWLEEQLRLMNQLEQRGRGPYSRNGVMQRLAQIR